MRASELLSSSIDGAPLSLLGTSVAVVASASGASSLVVGAPGFPIPTAYYSYYSWGSYKPLAEIAVFDGPLPQGSLDRTHARTLLLGSEWGDFDATPFEGMALTVGDLTGDGLDDFVSAGLDGIEAPYHVIEMPTPQGEFTLDDVAFARYGAVCPGCGVGASSTGDWNLDGILDLSFGGFGVFDPDNTFPEGGEYYYGAEVIPGPPVGAAYMGDIPTDGAIAWFNLFDEEVAPGDVGRFSTLIADVTGDGAAELLVSDYLYEVSGAERSRAFSLFSGDGVGGFGIDSALAVLQEPCEPYPIVPEGVGDVTGDGRYDVAVRGKQADVGEPQDGQEGAIWLLSELHSLAASPPGHPVSMTDYSAAILLGHDNEDLADMVGFDLDLDGQQDFAVLTEEHLYLFLGPLQGIRDLNEAHLVLLDAGTIWADGGLAAGDLSGDGIPELVVGDPQANGYLGQVRIYDGAAILAALP